MSLLHGLLESFLPLFVAIDALGMVPIFLAVTGHLTPAQRRQVTFQAVFAALAIATTFMLLGRAIFHFLEITENDFRIAGGILLLVLSILDLLQAGKPAVNEPDIVGIVPLAMPLIAGPAVLTTLLVLASRPDIGYSLTLLSLVLNLTFLLLVMLAASRIERLIGTAALRALSKLVMVLLAAIAVNFIRTGITNILRSLP